MYEKMKNAIRNLYEIIKRNLRIVGEEKSVEAVVYAVNGEGRPIGPPIEVPESAALDGGEPVTVKDTTGKIHQLDKIVVIRFPEKGKPEEIPLPGVCGWGPYPPAIINVQRSKVIAKVPYSSGYERLVIKPGSYVHLYKGVKVIGREGDVLIVDLKEDVCIRIEARELTKKLYQR